MHHGLTGVWTGGEIKKRRYKMMILLEALADMAIFASLMVGGTLAVSWVMWKMGRWPE